MGRDYSNKGCVTCKQRKKKCGEERPQCGACKRLGLPCSYDPSAPKRRGPRGNTILGTFDIEPLPVASNPSQALSIHRFRSQGEADVLYRAPAITLQFYTASAGEFSKDLTTLWQLMLQEDMVQSSIIACFSHVVGLNGDFTTLNRNAYGRALQLIQKGVLQPERGRRDVLAILSAIMFLGLLDSVGIVTKQDLLSHWKGCSLMIATHHESLMSWPGLPRAVYILIFEAIIFQFTSQAIFSADLIAAQRIWHFANIAGKVEEANPPDSDRIFRSPFLCGQYGLQSLLFEVAFWHRHPEQVYSLEQSAFDTEALVRGKKTYVEEEFKILMTNGNTWEDYRHTCERFHMLCNAILICVLSLQEATVERISEVDALASENAERLSRMSPPHAFHAHNMWSVQITMCALCHSPEFQSCLRYFEDFNKYMDPGHSTRAAKVFARIQQIRDLEALTNVSSISKRTTQADLVDEQASNWDLSTELLGSNIMNTGTAAVIAADSNADSIDSSSGADATASLPEFTIPDTVAIFTTSPSMHDAPSAHANTSTDPTFDAQSIELAPTDMLPFGTSSTGTIADELLVEGPAPLGKLPFESTSADPKTSVTAPDDVVLTHTAPIGAHVRDEDQEAKFPVIRYSPRYMSDPPTTSASESVSNNSPYTEDTENTEVTEPRDSRSVTPVPSILRGAEPPSQPLERLLLAYGGNGFPVGLLLLKDTDGILGS